MSIVDARIYDNPAFVPELIGKAIKALGSRKELASRLGVSERYLQFILKRERDASYHLQVCLESIIKEGGASQSGGKVIVDARNYDNRGQAPQLIGKVIEILGSQKELAGRLGISERYLQYVSKQERDASYHLQVCLEMILIEGIAKCRQ